MISADDGPVNGTTARYNTFDTIKEPAFVCALLLLSMLLPDSCVNVFVDVVADGSNGSNNGEGGNTIECVAGNCGCILLLGYKRKLRWGVTGR